MSSEAEEYARGFEVALNNLRNNENAQQQSTTENDTTKFLSGAVTIVTNPPATTSTATSSANRMCGGSVTYTNLGKLCHQFNGTKKKNIIAFKNQKKKEKKEKQIDRSISIDAGSIDNLL